MFFASDCMRFALLVRNGKLSSFFGEALLTDFHKFRYVPDDGNKGILIEILYKEDVA